ncbi:MAG: geranylgeranylglyceryl phosphate synthase family protein [Chitinophagales bacterium]|nr:geranylgeranylglyceryl phosphate synthase family protein [Chitinophagales bacterium]
MFSIDKLKGSKALALLLDPDKTVIDDSWLEIIREANPDLILLGGSQPFDYHLLDSMVDKLKANLTIPLVGFPGTVDQIHPKYDALLALSVVQSSDANYIFSPLFKAAKIIDELNLSTYYTPYLIIGSSGETAVEKALENKISIIDNETVLKSYLLGLKILNPICLYLEAGSGSKYVINSEYVKQTRNLLLDTYLFAGGGVRNIKQAEEIWTSGADCLVVGNWVEDCPSALINLANSRNILNGR